MSRRAARACFKCCPVYQHSRCTLLPAGTYCAPVFQHCSHLVHASHSDDDEDISDLLEGGRGLTEAVRH